MKKVGITILVVATAILFAETVYFWTVLVEGIVKFK